MRCVPARVAVVALTLGLVAACDTGAPAPTQRAPSPAATTLGPEAAVTTTTLHLAAGDVEVEVHPLVRRGEHVVLTLDLSKVGGGSAFLSSALGGTPQALAMDLPTLSGLRLVDLDRDVVHTVATDADGDTVTTGENFITLDPDTILRLQTVYAAPPADVDSIGLFVPGGPYLAEVPVTDGDVPPPTKPGTTSDGEVEALDLTTVAAAPVVDLASFTAELGGAVQTLTTSETVEATLGSDVLFAVDSADLADGARAALDAVAAHLEGREPGEVLVVGHTDDVADDAYNQALSERRAAAVAAELAQRIDTTRFELRTEGRGEAEPLVRGTDADARARNRRVTVTLTSQITRSTEVTTTGELPPIDGPVGTGAAGVVVDNVGQYRITAPQARRVHGHIVVDLQVTPLNESARNGVSFLSGVFHYRGDAWSVQVSASGVVLLRGATAVYPMDHLLAVSGDGHEQWLPLTDLETRGDLADGATRTFSIVYPDVGDLDEVAVQVGGGLGARAFRLTDIPVR